MSLHPRDPDDPDAPVASDDLDDEGESVAFEERPEPAYDRFDCTDGQDTTEAIDAARRAVSDGACVVLPTDTVYGIGADAFNGEAVQRLLDAKNRGRDMPPPVLIGDASLLRALATEVPDVVHELVEAHWPGPLTIVCRIQPSLRMDLGETGGTIALRVPDHALAREVLRRTGPLAVSSANLSGQPAALTCDEAVDQLGERVAVYLDGGPAGTEVDGARVSPPSTIVDFTRRDGGQLLRRGALDLETLRRVLPDLADLDEPATTPEPEKAPEPEKVPEPDGPAEH
ncbi:tRNA threonylcarbamoyl adenosine modification protein, Sua5/YciO/YrdC/YwlC family [Microlunatus sagamiharensis]|uniref:L-threonylcarbamoyladenylate synthase n=1 Tax=Microlunatus sagamiharensis TaxID=546874 RepID=A0A1H2M9J0_9ACTN|nr:L-threonylcarbamoyladenylate synthase [Microlunatus sagamiharensis]SDU89917.1 tRNA threonylcarbamoyl adenosine modification protein, Sua5/YciO/YrdC/YwlC family [Microlunatus sagamiharensis]